MVDENAALAGLLDDVADGRITLRQMAEQNHRNVVNLQARLQAAEALLDAVLYIDEAGVPQSKAHSADLALGVHWNDPDAALAAADAWNKARGWEPAGSDWLVTVCESCRRASCWQGDSMCEEARGANVVQVMRSQLLIERREHSDFWQHDRPTGNQPT